MRAGIWVLVIGVALVAIGFGTTEADINPVTMEMERIRSSPSPIAWIVLIAGIVMTIAGYAKRNLTAVESRI